LSLPEGPREPFGEAYARVARRDGAVVQAGNHAYTLRVTGPLGDTTVISRDAARVPVSTAERTQWRAWADYLAQEERTRGITHRFLAVPETKPVFRDIMADADSRVWIDRYVPAVDQPRPAREGRPAFRWREPVTYDVIAPDGRFLGTIRPPVPMRVIAARGSVFWGVAEGEAGEQYVVRYRIVRDG
jgi:hypothetical protein